MVEDVLVTALDRRSDGFELRLANGEGLRAKTVVIATGLSHAEYMSPELAQLPEELRSHSGVHQDLSRFRGRDVVVVGAGQSALETAAQLNEESARASLFVRGASVSWNREAPPLEQRSLWQRIRRPELALNRAQNMILRQCPDVFYHSLNKRASA